jgi:purine-binding chemotaxis protein CheW
MQTDTQQPSGGLLAGGLKDESQLVTFLLKDEEFGFDIMSVQEIIRLPKMAKVPRTPAYVDGIANLRGVVLPVVDMRTRFGMDRAEETDRTRVLVVDIEGVKTGLRVDRVKEVTRVLRSQIEPPPAAIRGTTADYVEGIVKLDNGQRIVMALNAAQVCEISIVQKAASPERATSESGSAGSLARAEEGNKARSADAEVQKMVTFRIAKEEFAFHMEHVREILRVQTPNQVPDVPNYVLGVLTVRGQVLPVIDLRRLLQQRSLAEEFADSCRALREEYERWIEQTEKMFAGGSQSKVDASVTEHLRKWLAETNSSSQLLMEALAKARGLNEKTVKQLQMRTRHQERGDHAAATACGAEVLLGGRETVAALRRFEQQIAENIQEDQRIIVVDAEGFVLGLVVDHVHEVLNVPKNLVEPPPRITSSGGMELSGVAKLDDGSRLIMLLDVANLMKDQKLREVQNSSQHGAAEEKAGEIQKAGAGGELSEVQLVTFLLGAEEFGIPISQIQEIDRLGKITKVPKAAAFIEGITNLRGEVIPVLDTRKRFDLEVKPADDRTRIIIVDLGGVKTGLVVDSVREVLNLARKDIAPPPETIGTGIDQQFISGIGKVDAGKRMIVLLDVERILSRQEQAHLAEVTA